MFSPLLIPNSSTPLASVPIYLFIFVCLFPFVPLDEVNSYVYVLGSLYFDPLLSCLLLLLHISPISLRLFPYLFSVSDIPSQPSSLPT